MKTKTTFFFGLLLGTFISVSTFQAQSLQWADKMGGTNNEQANAIAVDATGNVITAGTFGSPGDYDPGPASFNLTPAGNDDVFISKLDAAGNFVWAKKVGGTANDRAHAMTLDAAGNIYIAGEFSSFVSDFDPGIGTFTLASQGTADIFVLKLDASGNFVWAKQLGSPGGIDRGQGIAVDAAGNVYTTGEFQGTADFDPSAGSYTFTSAGFADIFISKLDASGNFVWAKQIGSTTADVGYAIDVDATGNVYTTGYYKNWVDFDPGAGVFTLMPGGSNPAIFVSKLDAGGNFVWAQDMSASGPAYGYDIKVDVSGNVYTTGSFQNGTDFDPGVGTYTLAAVGSYAFVSKLNASGNFVWAKSFEGAQCEGQGLALDAAGNVYTTGYFPNTTDFDPGAGTYTLATFGSNDIFISKLDASGNFVWAGSMGGASSDWGMDIVVDANSIYTTGYFFGNCDLDPTPGTFTVSATNANEIFVVKISNSITTGINKNNELNNISVYPNPFTDNVIFKLENSGKETTVMIYNSIGQVVYSEKSNSGEIVFQGGDLPAGIYFYKAVREGSITVSGKLLAK